MKHCIGKSFIKYNEDMGELVINKLYVHPSQRGQRLGYRLLDVAVDYAGSKNIANVGLFAESDEDSLSNEKLIEYYKGYGFESDGDCDELMNYSV